jgi:hypothetical protein
VDNNCYYIVAAEDTVGYNYTYLYYIPVDIVDTVDTVVLVVA